MATSALFLRNQLASVVTVKRPYGFSYCPSSIIFLFRYMLYMLRCIYQITFFLIKKTSICFSAILQVSISLSKVEISVGQSKYFTCTGKQCF